MSTFETATLLQDGINVPPQHETTDVKFPCTGFVYLVLQNLEHVVQTFQSNDKLGYYNLIKNLILQAADRKKTNSSIPFDGEFINHQTVQQDFSEIYQQTEYSELGITTELDYEILLNNVFMKMLELPVNRWIIVNRSHETFVMIKVDGETYLIVDSHKTKHATVNTEDAIKYITRNGTYRGFVQLGIFNLYNY